MAGISKCEVSRLCEVDQPSGVGRTLRHDFPELGQVAERHAEGVLSARRIDGESLPFINQSIRDRHTGHECQNNGGGSHTFGRGSFHGP